MEPPTATMAICPAVSWWRRPDSFVGGGGSVGASEGKAATISKSSGMNQGGRRALICEGVGDFLRGVQGVQSKKF